MYQMILPLITCSFLRNSLGINMICLIPSLTAWHPFFFRESWVIKKDWQCRR